MISFRINSHRFHLRAAAIVLEHDHLLLHKREDDNFWALPGGRVEAGEEASRTIIREFREELNLGVTCNALCGVCKNFFDSDGEPHHELGLYFSVSLPARSEIRNTGQLHMGVEGGRRLEFKWFSLLELPEIDFRPVTLRDSLASGTMPAHFVLRG